MIVVVDASVAVKWFVKEDGHSSALGLLDAGLMLTAPDLICAEAANVLWKKLKKGEVTIEQAEAACEALPDFLTEIAPSGAFLGEALRFAHRLEHPVYDCIYLAYAVIKPLSLSPRIGDLCKSCDEIILTATSCRSMKELRSNHLSEKQHPVSFTNDDS